MIDPETLMSYIEYVEDKIDLDEMPLKLTDWLVLEEQARKEYKDSQS